MKYKYKKKFPEVRFQPSFSYRTPVGKRKKSNRYATLRPERKVRSKVTDRWSSSSFEVDLLLSLPAAGWPTIGWNERNKNPLIEVDPRCQSLESQPSLTFGRYWKKTRSSQPMVGRNLDLLLSSSTSKDWLMDER